MVNWHERNPHRSTDGFLKQANWEVKHFGRTQFASNYARGGIAYTAFAPNLREAFTSPWKTTWSGYHTFPGTRIGSETHFKGLDALESQYGPSKNLTKARESLTTKKKPWKELSGWGKTGRVAFNQTSLTGLGLAAGVGFVAHSGYSAYAAGGTKADVAKAMGAEMAGAAGSAIGLKIGASAGAFYGGLVGGAPGMAIGAGVGWLAGMMGGYGIGASAFMNTVGLSEGLVDRHRSKRAFNWVGSTEAFDTQKSHTMRQQSLQLMNRGMMTARSALGREAVMLHQ